MPSCATLRGELLGSTPEPSWGQFAGAGWLGLEVSEALGGAGATFAETAVVIEELGRATTASSYLGSAVLGVGALNLAAPSRQRDELLTGISVGSAIIAVVLTDAAEPGFTVDGNLRLSGSAAFVPDAPAAHTLLVVAADSTGTPCLVAVAVGSPGLLIRPQPVLDETRSLGQVDADQIPIDQAAVWAFDGGPSACRAALLTRAKLAIAGDSLGLSEAMLAATVDYVKVRRQFDRPIGSFQAVKHACANMAVDIAIGRALFDTAVAQVLSGADDAWVAVSMAKAAITESAVTIAGQAMQLHGGIGYTWESGIHTYLKRAALNRSLFGSPAAHRRRLATRYRGSALG